ncbi:MAG: gliding motility lipoprotein GldH [Bacteroidales bacterium]|nr:gliding motility lipoprotein GldH [Bacteroidales bacterium]
MTAKKTFLYIGSIFAFLFLYSCRETTLFKKSIAIPENLWQVNDTLDFQTEITDNENFFNIFLNVNVKENYLTDNIWLIIDSESPSGNILNDTIMFFIFDQTGKPYGKKHGNIIKNKFLYKAHILFPEKGTYKFTVRHGMRKNDLPRVSSVGLSIEKAE